MARAEGHIGVDERWTPGQDDDQPSSPPDPQASPSGNPEVSRAQEAEQTPDSTGRPAPPSGGNEVEDVGDPAVSREPRSTANPYTIPGPGSAPASSWTWASALGDARGTSDLPVTRSWLDEPELPRPVTGRARPDLPAKPDALSDSGEMPVARTEEPGNPVPPIDDPAKHDPGHLAGANLPEKTDTWSDTEPERTSDLASPPLATEQPTHQPWDHEPHEPWEGPDEPAREPWQTTEPSPHQPWDHEPTDRPWQSTEQPTQHSWGNWYDPGSSPSPHENSAHNSAPHQPLDDTASFPAPPYQPHTPSDTNQIPAAPHASRGAGEASPWSPFRYDDAAPDVRSPTPDSADAYSARLYAPGADADHPDPHGGTGHEAGAESEGDAPHGSYDPVPAGDIAASYRTSEPGDTPPPSQEHEELAGSGDESPRRSRKGWVIGIASTVMVLALIGGGISWYVWSIPQPEDTAQRYASAWGKGNYEAMAGMTTGEGSEVEKSLTQFADNLGVTEATVDVGEVSADGDNATAPYEATLSLKNAGDLSYEGELTMARQDGEWLVDFSPAVMHPDLEEGMTLIRVNAWGERGHILATDGTRIDTEDPGSSLGMIVGQVGAAEEEDLERLGPAYEVGDPTGVSGLQKAFEERLAGEAGTVIHIVEEGEEQTTPEDDATVVESIEGTDGKDVATTLDPTMQSAAAAAITGETDPTAITAIRASTGEVLATANIPGGYNRAFEGQYAPGSAFKIITYQALLANGLGADSTMNCPKEANVGGWDFTNAGEAEYGQQNVTEAFATSCNTALVQEVANRLDSESATAAAERFGMNSDLDVGVPTTEPSFPAPENTTMLASQSIGQGQILTSPLHMATVPAAIADGSWRSPTLVSEPEPDQPEPTPIDHADQLRPMMREVVTTGTADGANFSGEVYGKTGSAEFGTAEDEDDELDSHAWFVGYQGDVAFSVVVEGGGGGGDVAAPIAAKFANAL